MGKHSNFLGLMAFVGLSVSTSLWATPSKLTKKYFRETNPQITGSAFETKWQDSIQETPLALFRAFVPTYYADVKDLEDLGPLGICLGDPHSENFSFIQMDDGPEYLFSDFDDSGYCPISLDALRYFVAMDLNGEEKQVKRLIQEYVEALSSGEPGPKVPSSDIPDLEKKRKKNLEKYTDDDEFIVDDADSTKDLVSVSPKKKAEIQAVMESVLPRHKILDIAGYTKSDGGSGGLTRYWVLVSKGRTRDILELKPEPAPGVEQGHWKSNPNPRISWVVKNIWNEAGHEYYESVSLFGKEYLLRSRSYENVDVDIMEGKERILWRRLQVHQMARHHAKFITGLKQNRWLEAFLIENTEKESARFQAAFDSARW